MHCFLKTFLLRLCCFVFFFLLIGGKHTWTKGTMKRVTRPAIEKDRLHEAVNRMDLQLMNAQPSNPRHGISCVFPFFFRCDAPFFRRGSKLISNRTGHRAACLALLLHMEYLSFFKDS